MNFLTRLGQNWNISMFHYRNHGAAYGRCLVGLQTPQGSRRDLERALRKIDYRYWDETDNPAYTLYLQARQNQN